MPVLDTIHGTLEDVYNTSQPNIDYGQVNELSQEDLRKRRRNQLIVGIVLVAIVVTAIFLFKKSSKK
jgi:cobalamin biosynthesis protein CobD/CbiB